MAEKVAFAELFVRNVKVINCSYALTNNTRAIEYYRQKGNQKKVNELLEYVKKTGNILADFLNRWIEKGYDFVIVCGAGNDSNGTYEVEINKQKETVTTGNVSAQYASNLNSITEKDFPSVYRRIIVVGAFDPNMKISSYSNREDRVDIYAPGGGVDKKEGVFSTLPNNAYGFLSGTSMATPHVSGAAAIAWSINNNLTGPAIKALVVQAVNPNNSDYKMLDVARIARVALMSKTSTNNTPTQESENGVY
jgi:hypothetical protein